MRTPRLQFSVRNMMLGVGGVALALAYLGAGSTKLGCGSATVRLRFQIVNEHDGQPIAGARIELFRDLSAPPMARVSTEADGRAVATCQTGCTSYSGPFFRKYRCLNYGEGLRVEASGFQSVETVLREYTTYPEHHNSSAPPPITVRLKRAPATNPPS
jgi:5-hydroxyisourate hydrolase-like protein (transthyretin family)